MRAKKAVATKKTEKAHAADVKKASSVAAKAKASAGKKEEKHVDAKKVQHKEEPTVKKASAKDADVPVVAKKAAAKEQKKHVEVATAKKAGEDGDAGTHSERERASTDSFESDILRMEMDNWDPYLDMMQPSAIVRRNGGRESMIGVEEGADGVKFDDEDAQPRKENDPLADMPRLEVELEIAETLAPDPIKTGGSV